MERIAAAVVGFGRFGRLHALRLQTHPKFRLACVVDICPEARQRACELGYTALASLDEIPAHVRVAAVTSTSHTHAEVASHLMRRGLDVLVEKPLATSEAEIDAVLAVWQETGRTLCTGHIERFNPREILVSSALGADGLEFRRFARAQNSGREAVMDLMVHDLDLAAYWLALPADGEIEVTEVRLGDHEIEARVVIGGTPLRFYAGYGVADSKVEILHGGGPFGIAVGKPGLIGEPAGYPGEDALTRQYSAFHAMLTGDDSAIADGMAGAVAARRALAILRAL